MWSDLSAALCRLTWRLVAEPEHPLFEHAINTLSAQSFDETGTVQAEKEEDELPESTAMGLILWE